MDEKKKRKEKKKKKTSVYAFQYSLARYLHAVYIEHLQLLHNVLIFTILFTKKIKDFQRPKPNFLESRLLHVKLQGFSRVFKMRPVIIRALKDQKHEINIKRTSKIVCRHEKWLRGGESNFIQKGTGVVLC